ncbi:MAG: CRISPR-associated endonuclease Cas1, partial [Anaerovoracaceae bacterium]
LIQGHEVTIDDFSQDFDTGGIFIVNRGMEVFLKKFEKKLSTQTKYLSYEKSSMSFRRAIQRQVEALTKAIEEEEPEIYLPIRIR